jgi:hypothetical protein
MSKDHGRSETVQYKPGARRLEAALTTPPWPRWPARPPARSRRGVFHARAPTESATESRAKWQTCLIRFDCGPTLTVPCSVGPGSARTNYVVTKTPRAGSESGLSSVLRGPGKCSHATPLGSLAVAHSTALKIGWVGGWGTGGAGTSCQEARTAPRSLRATPCGSPQLEQTSACSRTQLPLVIS